MKNTLLLFLFGFFVSVTSAQITKPTKPNRDDINSYRNDSTRVTRDTEVIIEGATKYTDYKLISLNNDTTFIDTVLNIQKDYKLNYNRKDNFEKIAFHNMGQTYNNLGYSFQNETLFPSMGFNSKLYNYKTLNDVFYYHVPTPTSEIMAKTGLEQGQVLDAFLTANTSRQFNISVSYKGLRSLGKYRHAKSSHGNFLATTNYQTEDRRYILRAHMYSFDLLNEQNGGLTDASIAYFENNDPNYTKRSRMDVNFTNAENMYEGKRYYLDHSYALFTNREITKKKKKTKDKEKLEVSKKERTTFKKDSIVNTKELDSIQTSLALASKTDSLTVVSAPIPEKTDSITTVKTKKPLWELLLGNYLKYETKHYRYTQTAASSTIGEAFTSEIKDHTSYQNFDAQLFLQMNSAHLGTLKIRGNYYDYNYHYNSILYYDDYTIEDNIQGSSFSFGADWKKNFGGFAIQAEASSMAGDINGSTIKAAISYEKDSLFNVIGFAEFTSKSPDFNKLLLQSDYKDYNWQNNFNNEDITTFGGEFNSEKWVTLQASFNSVNNYTYFNENSAAEQASENLNYFKVKLIKAFTVGKFTLDNTVMYQDVFEGDNYFRVPNWVTRNTLYFASDVFKGDPLYLETGVTFNYFTKYKMNAYDPVIADFVLQNEDEIGNFPMLDFFLNFRVQRTRFYFKLENFTSSFTGRNYYSAPSYPYRDMTFRFGLVWNFFI